MRKGKPLTDCEVFKIKIGQTSPCFQLCLHPYLDKTITATGWSHRGSDEARDDPSAEHLITLECSW